MPRVRMFAGPNGSGKSSLYRKMCELGAFSSALYQNADEVEKALRETRRINFHDWNLHVTKNMWLEFFRNPEFGRDLPAFPISIANNTLTVQGDLSNSYFASILCDFMRSVD